MHITLYCLQKRRKLEKDDPTQSKTLKPKLQSCSRSSSESEDQEAELIKEAAVSPEWILNKEGVFEDEKQKNAPIIAVVQQKTSQA